MAITIVNKTAGAVPYTVYGGGSGTGSGNGSGIHPSGGSGTYSGGSGVIHSGVISGGTTSGIHVSGHPAYTVVVGSGTAASYTVSASGVVHVKAPSGY
ncbi:MAG TPA: hypothetical protein VHR45_15825 [Thermoanaerobaculia bacterium]|nr:hypothetical protein [Thermoanaerobaculia bacterium]